MTLGLSWTYPKAKKRHCCDHCFHNIDIGEVYFKNACVDEGRVYSFKAHRDCQDAWDELDFDRNDDFYPLFDCIEEYDAHWLKIKYPRVYERRFCNE